MATPPPGLVYGLEDTPPPKVLLALAVQHIFLMSSSLVLPVVLVSEIGGSFEEVRSVVALTMIACGIGTAAQAVRSRHFGSGFLCPNLPGPNFFAVSMEAAWLGGLPLMRGMTIAAGLFEAVFARFIHRLRFLFPPEITGLVVLMVAEGLVPIATSKVLGIGYAGEPIELRYVVVAGVTLLSMVGINVFGKGRLRLYGVLTGMTVGYALSLALGLVALADVERLARSPWIALPALAEPWAFSFRWSVLPAFLIVSVTGALKSFGNLILCERTNDADWKEPDLKRVSGGLLADSLAVTVSGILGGMASDTSASNVSLSAATGATSRRIGLAAGALFAVLGFSPKVGAVLSVMPPPVMGAILFFVTSYMLLSGIQIIVGSGVDARKNFVIGIALVLGLSADIVPALWAGVPGFLRPIVGSSLTFATVTAVLLNQLLTVRKVTPAEPPPATDLPPERP